MSAQDQAVNTFTASETAKQVYSINSATSTSERVRDAQAAITLEEDPHRAALEDNPEEFKISANTWAAIGFLSLSFGPAIGLPFLSFAAVVMPVYQELGGTTDYAWVIGAWSLASAVSFAIAGPLSDIFGRKIPILFGQVLVIIGCIVAASAQRSNSLIVGEALIGFGTGFLFVSYAGVPEMLPNKWRSLGLGVLELGLGTPWGLAAALIGNTLYEKVSWRWIFYISIILEVISILGTAWFYRPTSRPRGDFDKSRWDLIREIDFVGFLLFVGGLTTLLIGVTWGGSATHPWKSVSTILPIVLGFVVLVVMFLYESKANNPMFPLSLLAQFRQYTVLLVVLFVSGMNFYSMSSLLPQGSATMFTTNPTTVGLMSLPNNIMNQLMGTVIPGLAHKIGHIKIQLIFALVMQCAFVAAIAGSVYPNHEVSWIILPVLGTPMFAWITILAYSIASLHVPHSRLGVAMGLLGTFRATGGAVGNAVFTTILTNSFKTYSESEIASVALAANVPPTELPILIPALIQYNAGAPPSILSRFPDLTPDLVRSLRSAVRLAYGHAYKIVFFCTIPFGVIAVVAALFVEDSTKYLTNHIQTPMEQLSQAHDPIGILEGKDSAEPVHVES